LIAPYMPERYDHIHAYDLNIIQVAVDQLPAAVFRALHPSVFENSYNILVTYWELPAAPKEWRIHLERINGVRYCPRIPIL
jgi:hypothetical protein